MEHEMQRKLTDVYMAEHLWMATAAIYAMGGGKLDTPHYTDLIGPSAQDNRAAEEIKADLIKKLDE